MANHVYTQAELDNHSNQLNPNNPEYWHCRGLERPVANHVYTQAELDNHSNQLNPNNPEYWHCRGLERPVKEGN